MEQVNVIGKNGVILEESYIFGIESEKIVATEPLKSQTGTKITYAEAIESRDNPDILYVEESYAAVNGIIAGEKASDCRILATARAGAGSMSSRVTTGRVGRRARTCSTSRRAAAPGLATKRA